MEKLTIKLGVPVLLLFSLLVLQTQNVFACSPGGPNPWFATQLSFERSTLPSGIEIVQTDPTYEPYALINKSPDPFYLVSEINPVLLSPAYGNEYRFPNSELPENYEPHYKITSSQVYFWGQLSSQDSEGWKPNSGGINNSAATRVRVGEDIYILDGESRQIFKDNRPAVVEIPSPQNFKILGFSKGNPVEIRGTLNYSLNEKYDPQAFAKGVEACNEWGQSLNSPFWKILSFAPVIIILFIFSGIGFLIYKIIKRFKK